MKYQFLKNCSNQFSRCFSTSVSNKTARSSFEGVWPIVATPFHSENEKIDYKSYENIIDFFGNKLKVNGLTIIGVLGESNRLIDSERNELISIASKTALNTPICVGTSHSGTYATIKLSEEAIKYGASSLMITPSYEPIPNQTRIIEYYKKITSSLSHNNIPIVLQDHPSSTQVHMALDTLYNIIDQCSLIKCIKLESLPTPHKIRTIKKKYPNMNILSGLGALYGLFDLESKSSGFMTGFAFPEVLQSMCYFYTTGDIDKAERIYKHFLPLIVFEQQPGVGIRKEIYKLRNIIDESIVRHPGTNCSQDTLEQLINLLNKTFGKEWEDIIKIPLNIDYILSNSN